MTHMTDRLIRHNCGGTILAGARGEQEHMYCDRCGAFVYVAYLDELDEFPTGVDANANRKAWDNGNEYSPS